MLGQIISFITSHATMLVAFVVAAIDFAWAMSDGLKSNGILHAIYNWAQSFLGKK